MADAFAFHRARSILPAMTYAIFTAIGSDRPGLVDQVSQFLFDRGGNIQDSRMGNLRGQFAMIVPVRGPDEAMAKIRPELGYFSHASQLHAEPNTTHAPTSPAADAP